MGSSITATSTPLRGFGTFQADATLYPPGTAKKAVLEALKVGYRHIDTAYGYGNGEIEREVGQAIKESGIPRKEIFLVTKLHNTFHDPADVETGLNMCLKNLGVDYVDLFLMHNPYAYSKGPKFSTLRREDGTGKPLMDMEMSRRYPDTWRAMHELVRKGKARQIGLSNFNILKTKRIIEETGIIPAANQVEMNPYFPQYELLDYCRSQNIQVIAHCPLGGALAPSVANRTGDGPLQDPTITKIAVAHDKTAAQVILAWLNGRGISVVPKSAKAERIRSNFDDWGSEKHFALTKAEDAEIAHLMGPRGEKGTRNLVNEHHIGFDVFDEALDQPV